MDNPLTSTRLDFDHVMKPFALPLGLASPMWLAYGAAASVGATWWWMSRMSRFVVPHMGEFVNAEAIAAEAPAPAPAPAFAEPMIAVVEPAMDTVQSSVSAAIPAPETVESTATAESSADRPDELTLLRGVGPRVADALVARGVTTFAQLAAWTDKELAAFDTEIKLLGRSKRYDFLGQAREMSAKV